MIDDVEYNVEDFTEEQKAMVVEINHSRQEAERIIYMAEVLKARSQSVGKLLVESVTKAEEEE